MQGDRQTIGCHLGKVRLLENRRRWGNRQRSGSIRIPLAAPGAQFPNLGKRLQLEPGIGRRTQHVDDEELPARFTHQVADDRQVKPVAAIQDPELYVEVPQGIAIATSLQADGAAGELDRVEDRRAMVDPERDVRGIKGGLSRGPRRIEQRQVAVQEVDEPQRDGQLAQVSLGDVCLALALDAADVVAQAAQIDRGVQRAAVRLPAGERPGIFLELCTGKSQRSAILRGGIETDRAAALQITSEQFSPQAVEPGRSALEVKGRFDVGDLLPQQTDAVQPDNPVDFQCLSIGPAANFLELALDMFERNPGFEGVVDEDDPGVVPAAPGRLAVLARPTDLEVAAGRERPAVVQPERKLGHQGRHDRAQVRVQPDLLDPEFAHRQGKAATVLDHHVSRGKLDRGAMEEEIDIVHDHLAVVEIKPAVNVLHSQLESSPGIETRLGRAMDHQAHARIAKRHDRNMIDVGTARLDVNGSSDVAGSGRVNDRPGLLPGRLQRLAKVFVEGQILGLDLQVDLQWRLAVWEVGPGEFLDPAVPHDDRLAVPSAHVLEFPEVRVQLEPAGQIADRVGQAGPGDLASRVEVEIGINDQVPLGLRPGPDHRPAKDANLALDRTGGVKPIDDLADILRQRGQERGIDRDRVGLDVQPDERVGPGVIDGSLQECRALADQAVQIDAKPLIFQRQAATHVLHWVGKVAIDGRYIAAKDRGTDTHRAVLPLSRQMNARIDQAAGFEDVPELGELGRGPLSEPLVQLQLQEIEAQIERTGCRLTQGQSTRGTEDRNSVAPFGVLDRDEAILNGHERREVIDRKGERGAPPDAAMQPRQHVIFKAAVSRGPGVKRQPAQFEVDLATVEPQRLGLRADLRWQAAAEVFRES